MIALLLSICVITMAIAMITTLTTQVRYALPPVARVEKTFIRACVMAHIHKLFVLVNNADRIKQLVKSAIEKSMTDT